MGPLWESLPYKSHLKAYFQFSGVIGLEDCTAEDPITKRKIKMKKAFVKDSRSVAFPVFVKKLSVFNSVFAFMFVFWWYDYGLAILLFGHLIS